MEAQTAFIGIEQENILLLMQFSENMFDNSMQVFSFLLLFSEATTMKGKFCSFFLGTTLFAFASSLILSARYINNNDKTTIDGSFIQKMIPIRLFMICASICNLQKTGFALSLLENGSLHCFSGRVNPNEMIKSESLCHYTFPSTLFNHIAQEGNEAGNSLRKYNSIKVDFKPGIIYQLANIPNNLTHQQKEGLPRLISSAAIATGTVSRMSLFSSSSNEAVSNAIERSTSKSSNATQNLVTRTPSSIALNQPLSDNSKYFVFLTKDNFKLNVLNLGSFEESCEKNSDSFPPYKIKAKKKKTEIVLKSLSEVMVIGFKEQVVVCGGVTKSDTDNGNPKMVKTCYHWFSSGKTFLPMSELTYQRAGGTGFVNEKGFAFIGGKTSIAEDHQTRYKHSNIFDVYKSKNFGERKSTLPRLTSSFCIVIRQDELTGYLIGGDAVTMKVSLHEFDPNTFSIGTPWPVTGSFRAFSCCLCNQEGNGKPTEAILISGVTEDNRVSSMIFDPQAKKWKQLPHQTGSQFQATKGTIRKKIQLLTLGSQVYMVLDGLDGILKYDTKNYNYSKTKLSPVESQIDLMVSNLASVQKTLGRNMCLVNRSEKLKNRKNKKQELMKSNQDRRREKELAKLERLKKKGKGKRE